MAEQVRGILVNRQLVDLERLLYPRKIQLQDYW